MVSARFQADFSQFATAVQKAELSLKSFETGAGKVEKSLSRMADGFSGRKVIQDATLAVEAVERIGGATMLTEREQAKLNAELNEALAKYRALGMEAPQSMRDLAAATDKIPETLTVAQRGANALKSSFGQMLGAFTAANVLERGVGTLVSWGKEAIDAAGAVVDLANKTGLSTDTIQRFQHVAGQTGSSVEAFTKAAFQLGVNVEKGKGHVEGLGVAFSELRALSPDQQFSEVVRHLEAMKDPQERNAAAVKLFGRSAAEILPSIQEGYAKIASEATVAGDAQIRALDNAGDAWDKFVGRQKTALTQFLGNQVTAAAAIGTLNPNQQATLNDLLATDAGKVTQFLARVARMNTDVHLASEKAARSIADEAKSLDAAREAARKAAEMVAALRAEAVELAERGLKRQTEETLKLRMAQLQTYPVMHQYLLEHRQDLILMPPVMRDVSQANQETTATLLAMVDAGMRVPVVTDAQRKGFLTVKEATTTWRGELESLARAMTDLAQVANNGLASALATMVNGINVGVKGVESLKGGFDQITSGGGIKSILSGFTGIVSGIGGIVSAAQAAIQIGKALFSVFDRDKGRDLVEDFVQQFGGFDGIQKIFAEMGEEGHRLWVMLTQGVGRNNPDQARRAIEEVTRAIEEYKRVAGTIPAANFYVNTIDAREGRGGIENGAAALLGNGSGGGSEEHVTNILLDGDVLYRHVETRLNRSYRNREMVGAV